MKALAEIWKDYKDKPDVVINDVFKNDVENEGNSDEGNSDFAFTGSKKSKDEIDSDTDYETDEESEFEDEIIKAETDEMSKEEKDFYKKEAEKVLEMKVRSLRLSGTLAKNKGFGYIIESVPAGKEENIFKDDDGIVDDDKLDKKFKVVKKKIKIRRFKQYGQQIGGRRDCIKPYWSHHGKNPFTGTTDSEFGFGSGMYY